MSDPAQLEYLHLHPGQALPAISAPQPSRIVVVIEASVSPDWQYAVSEWIVAYGCRYMMAWGPDCGSWDDSVDWSALEANDFAVPDDRRVMTTWHDDEPLEEAFCYCEFHANLSNDGVDLAHRLILHIAPEADDSRMRSAYAAMIAEACT